MKIRNLYDTLAATAAVFRDKIGISDGKEKIDYGELLQRTDCFSAYLKSVLQVKRGDCIGVLMLNSIEYVVLVYAAAKIGAKLVLINAKLHAKEISFILEDTKAKYLAIQADIWERVSHEIGKTQVQTLILDANVMFEHMEQYKVCCFSEGFAYTEEIIDGSEADQNTPIAVLYTSGTSGTPKGAEITNRAVLETVASYREILKLDENQSTLLAVPLFHVTGFSCIMAVFIAIGGYMRMIPSFHSDQSLKIMSEEHIRHFHAVPTIYQMLVNVMKDEYDLSSLESAVCGGGYIEDRLIKSFCSIAPNVSFHPAYGMTETAGGGVLFPKDYMKSSKKGSAGKVMDNCEITIFDDSNVEVPVGKIGQIAFRGPMIIRHYLNHKGDENFVNGWLLSGDLGYLDQDQYIYVVGRIKSMVNRGGEKIYSRFVEREILSNPKVNQCLVFPVKDFLFGEVPGCVIVPEKDQQITEKEIRDYLQERIQKTKIPVYIEFWDKLPNTASGKVKIAYLSRLFTEKYYSEEEKH
ncbi:MAG TPA: acyl--CoA ligase [Candidatus Blautia excrementipullorum]|nr:acyl--CoA ligase [Candidatus Blautia excrementipullorum]